jgi:heptosyltransferase I
MPYFLHMFARPPESVCLLRLSAIGDSCHVVPLVHRLRRAWPETRFTWIIGKLEHRLMSCLPGIEFLVYDKRAGKTAQRAFYEHLARQHFDALLHLQLSLRASVIACKVNTPIKLGFNLARARELQWLFTNQRIAPRDREHVLDSFQGFADALGVAGGELDFTIPLPEAAQDYAHALVPPGQRVLLVSPCSSHAARNWSIDRYVDVIAHAQTDHDLAVVLCGGPSALEKDMGAAIESGLARRNAHPIANQIGRDTLPQMQALLGRAAALITPDSGPAHMATLTNTPVIGLYAATNPERSGPYRSRQWCVNRYDDAARRFCGRPAAALPWTRKIEKPGVMDLITVDDVLERLSALQAAGLLKGAR